MEYVPSMVLIKDSMLRPVFANRLFRENFPADEWMGRTPEETFPPEVASEMRRMDTEAFNSGYTKYEEEWTDGSGVRRYLETRKFRIEQPASDPVLGVIITDVTESRVAENLLLEQGRLGQRLGAARSLLEIVDICLDAALSIPGFDCGGLYLVSDRDGSIDLVGHRGLPASFIEKYSHYPADSPNVQLVMKGEPVYSLWGKGAREERFRSVAYIPVASRENVVACLNLASHEFEEIPGRSKSALESIVSQMGQAILNAKADDEIYRERQNLEMLFRWIGDLVFVIDMQGCILKCNDTVFAKLGYDENELIGQPVLRVHPPEREDEVKSVVADIIAGNNNKCVIPLMTRDGRVIPVETMVTRGSWNSREVLFGVSRDMTELMSMQQKLSGALREKDALLREIQHRVMNNLVMISGLVELESERASGDETRRLLESLGFRVKSLANLYSLLHKTGNIQEIDLAEYFSLIIDNISEAYITGSRARVLRRLESIRIDANRSALLGLVLNELLTNALKYAFHGKAGGVLDVELRKAGGNVVLTVSDNGPGLQEGFDIKVAAGFGMMLVNMLTSQMGGDVRAVSNGRGATFEVAVPLVFPEKTGE